MAARRKRRRGRPPMRWLTGPQILALPKGSAVALDMGDKKHVVRGRIEATVGDELVLSSTSVRASRIARGRVTPGLFDPGDFVHRVGMPESQWRGGVIRCAGVEVLVESADGLDWWPETELVKALPTYARARN